MTNQKIDQKFIEELIKNITEANDAQVRSLLGKINIPENIRDRLLSSPQWKLKEANFLLEKQKQKFNALIKSYQENVELTEARINQKAREKTQEAMKFATSGFWGKLTEVEQLQTKITNLETQLTTNQQTLTQNQEQTNQLQQENQDLKQKITTLENQLKTQTETLKKIQKELIQANQKHQNHLTQEKAQLTKEIQLIKGVLQ